MASLALFNEEGEAEQAAIDIANALNISPGNLYYHFKGKDTIIRALFGQFEEEMRVLFAGAHAVQPTREDLSIYVHMMLEEIWDFRFFYLNLVALHRRYPDLALRFQTLRSGQCRAIESILDRIAEGTDQAFDADHAAAAEDVVTTLTVWPVMAAIDGVEADDTSLQEGVGKALSPLL